MTPKCSGQDKRTKPLKLQARKVVDGLLGQLVTIAKDVKIQLFFNPGAIAGWRLIGYENRVLRREDFSNDQVDAGEIGAGHTITALYELIPVGSAVPFTSNDGNPFVSTPQHPIVDPAIALRLRLRYKKPDGDTSILQEADVPVASTPMDDDFRFAAAIASFGMLLRASPYKGASTWQQIDNLARQSLGEDPRGLRSEFLALVHKAQALQKYTDLP